MNFVKPNNLENWTNTPDGGPGIYWRRHLNSPVAMLVYWPGHEYPSDKGYTWCPAGREEESERIKVLENDNENFFYLLEKVSEGGKLVGGHAEGETFLCEHKGKVVKVTYVKEEYRPALQCDVGTTCEYKVGEKWYSGWLVEGISFNGVPVAFKVDAPGYKWFEPKNVRIKL
jgi:hypothetical protein